LFREKAKGNLEESGRYYGKGSQKSAKPIESINQIETRKEIAKLAGVSHDTIDKTAASADFCKSWGTKFRPCERIAYWSQLWIE
jgi:hypothetical protein